MATKSLYVGVAVAEQPQLLIDFFFSTDLARNCFYS